MEGAPDKKRVNVENLIKEMKKCDPNMEMDRLHVWSITNSKVAMSCHVKTKLDTRLVLKQLNAVCSGEKFRMHHVTIQIEDANNDEHQFEKVESPKFLKDLLQTPSHGDAEEHGHHH